MYYLSCLWQRTIKQSIKTWFGFSFDKKNRQFTIPKFVFKCTVPNADICSKCKPKEAFKTVHNPAVAAAKGFFFLGGGQLVEPLPSIVLRLLINK